MNLLDRRSNLLVSEIDALRDVVRETLTIRPFPIDEWDLSAALAVLPGLVPASTSVRRPIAGEVRSEPFQPCFQTTLCAAAWMAGTSPATTDAELISRNFRVLVLPPGDADLPNRWRAIEALFSRRVAHPQHRRPSLARKREAGVWQRRYWEHTVRDDGDYAAHMDYVHCNPVKHGLAGHPAAWPYSSFLRCVAKGVYPAGWAIDACSLTSVGERRGAVVG